MVNLDSAELMGEKFSGLNESKLLYMPQDHRDPRKMKPRELVDLFNEQVITNRSSNVNLVSSLMHVLVASPIDRPVVLDRFKSYLDSRLDAFEQNEWEKSNYLLGEETSMDGAFNALAGMRDEGAIQMLIDYLDRFVTSGGYNQKGKAKGRGTNVYDGMYCVCKALSKASKIDGTPMSVMIKNRQTIEKAILTLAEKADFSFEEGCIEHLGDVLYQLDPQVGQIIK